MADDIQEAIQNRQDYITRRNRRAAEGVVQGHKIRLMIEAVVEDDPAKPVWTIMIKVDGIGAKTLQIREKADAVNRYRNLVQTYNLQEVN